MIKFPKIFDIILDGYEYTNNKQFNEINKSYLIVNKRSEQKQENVFKINLILCKDELAAFDNFYDNDTFKGILEFEIDIVEDSRIKSISASIISSVQFNYENNSVNISFDILKNYDII